MYFQNFRIFSDGLSKVCGINFDGACLLCTFSKLSFLLCEYLSFTVSATLQRGPSNWYSLPPAPRSRPDTKPGYLYKFWLLGCSAYIFAVPAQQGTRTTSYIFTYTILPMNLFRDVFISLSRSQSLRRFAENSPLARKVSGRFVAGVSLSKALVVCQEENRQGRSVTLDALGENVQSEEHAEASAAVYHLMLDRIAEMGLDANVSLKLTQMGMDLGVGIAESMVHNLSEHAYALNNFVRVDMEGSPYTQDTIGIVTRLHGAPAIGDSVGVVVQAYLFRTEADVDHLIAKGIRVRLCKGAYKEPETIAFAAKSDVDANYVKLMKRLLTSGVFHGLATHDENIIQQAKTFVAEQGIDRSSFEFQMLYGIRRDLQDSLVKQGYRVRVYVPFGEEWYPYFMRRLAERPANALFIAKNFFR